MHASLDIMIVIFRKSGKRLVDLETPGYSFNFLTILDKSGFIVAMTAAAAKYRATAFFCPFYATPPLNQE